MSQRKLLTQWSVDLDTPFLHNLESLDRRDIHVTLFVSEITARRFHSDIVDHPTTFRSHRLFHSTYRSRTTRATITAASTAKSTTSTVSSNESNDSLAFRENITASSTSSSRTTANTAISARRVSVQGNNHSDDIRRCTPLTNRSRRITPSVLEKVEILSKRSENKPRIQPFTIDPLQF